MAQVRLDHMLRRMRVLEEAATACAPVRILGTSPGLWLGGATAADSHHVLRHLGITHIVNATEVGVDSH
jgi:atypical dual specificity phosphatase